MGTSVHPPLVSVLECEFDGWLGDDLLESFPCFIVTERLGNLIEKNSLTGCVLSSVLVSTSDTFDEMHPDVALPNFYWLRIQDQAGIEDMGLSKSNHLVVSERFLKILLQVNSANRLTEQFTS